MPECRLATDVFPFRGVDLRIVRRDISGDGGGDAAAWTATVTHQEKGLDELLHTAVVRSFFLGKCDCKPFLSLNIGVPRC